MYNFDGADCDDISDDTPGRITSFLSDCTVEAVREYVDDHL